MKHFGIPAGYMDSLVFVESGKVYYKSDAVLRMTRKLNGLWPVCSIFIVIPRFIRDYFYDRIAVNRIKWFGRTDTCWVMKEEYKDRFLN